MKLTELNALEEANMKEELTRCNGSSKWVQSMILKAPYANMVELHEKADECWDNCNNNDFLEAFKHHPKIGDVNSLKEKFASTASWSEGEQSGVAVATEDIIKKLALLNEDYYTKHGFIFIVCATGKTAGEMLEILEGRLPNSTEMEILQAAEEQRKITHLRINKLLS